MHTFLGKRGGGRGGTSFYNFPVPDVYVGLLQHVIDWDMSQWHVVDLNASE